MRTLIKSPTSTQPTWVTSIKIPRKSSHIKTQQRDSVRFCNKSYRWSDVHTLSLSPLDVCSSVRFCMSELGRWSFICTVKFWVSRFGRRISGHLPAITVRSQIQHIITLKWEMTVSRLCIWSIHWCGHLFPINFLLTSVSFAKSQKKNIAFLVLSKTKT